MPDYTLQKHQVSAVKQLNNTNSLIANHGLGSGKTVTSIEAGEQTPGSKMIVAPASLLGNYSKELKKFNVNPKDYHLLSYERFRKRPQHYIDKYKPQLMIADEFHRSDNPDSLLSSSVREIRSQVPKVIGLTGSLIQNHPSEIGELLHNVTGKPLLGNNPNEFRKRFIREKKVSPGLFGRILGKTPGIIEEPKNLKEFKDIASKYINTFTGDEEYKKHIPLVEKEVRHIDMSKDQNKIYDYTFDKVPAWVKWKIRHNIPTSKKESKNLNAFLIGARQASNSTDSFGGTKQTPKIQALMHDILHGTKHDPNFKSVVYSNFLESGIDPVERELKKANIPYGRFTGNEDSADRNETIQNYNKGKLKSLLLSPAGGEGLDLKGTKFMGILESNWNPEKTNQAIGRVARFKSHESLPENERKVKVVEYLSTPRLGLIGKIRRHFNPSVHAIGTDDYIRNTANQKALLNKQFTKVLEQSNDR